MDGGAFGAGKAGGAFDPHAFIRQPHTLLRLLSWRTEQDLPWALHLAVEIKVLLQELEVLQVFSIVVFGSIVNEGYVNRPDETQEHCIFNRNRNACNYGITVGVLAFLSCLLYLALDAYFPQISSVKDRKKAVLSDIGVSGQGCEAVAVSESPGDHSSTGSPSGSLPRPNASPVIKHKQMNSLEVLSADTYRHLDNLAVSKPASSLGLRQAAQSEFGPICNTLVGQAFLAYQRFRLGADSALFSQDYMDPSQDSGMPYAPYVNEEDATDAVGTYQQPPPADAFDTETQGYQTQNY
ncbi:hypothetical protein QYF61_014117 [Mycteria americana]|uniref:Synaptogyrin-1 n=1 Tax=Mycteria americana TaxID=33587 RepID=A0AAN7PT86_MYCAM|nr:hypothetical protein QYF61_014117 [Mycteria americana]